MLGNEGSPGQALTCDKRFVDRGAPTYLPHELTVKEQNSVMRSRRGAVAFIAAAVLVSAMLVSATPTSYEPPPMVANPVEHVDTLIGTGNGGKTVGEINNFPGPSVPFGMVQYSPDTVGNYAGYSHSNGRSTGFSMTHASVGCPAFGDISMLPTTSSVGSEPWNASEEIAHDKHERGVPGYYTVRLPSAGVTAELTATNRTGVGRFHYPNDRAARFFVRPGRSLGGTSAAKIKIEDDNTTITGQATSGGFCGKNNVYTVYFAMKFSKPFKSFGTWDGFSVFPNGRSAYSSYQGSSGGYVEFPAGSDLEVRTALSYVDVDGARKNLDEAAVGFDDARAAASKQWNDALSRIRVAGYTQDDIVTFYCCALPFAVEPQHIQRRRRPLHRVRPRDSHCAAGPHAVRQLLRLGHLPRGGGAAGHGVSAGGQRHGAVVGQRRRAERVVPAVGAGQHRDRGDDRRQRGAADRELLCVRRQGL